MSSSEQTIPSDWNILYEYNHCVVAVNPDNDKMYQIFSFKKPVNKNNDCRELCSYSKEKMEKHWWYKLFKPFWKGYGHWSCRFCRLRKAYTGEIPLRIEVKMYHLLVRVDRKYERTKRLLFRRTMNIAEALGN